MIVSIPLPVRPFVTQSTSLDGRAYKLTFDWNSRSDRWTLGIDTEDGDPVIHGAVLVVGLDLLRTVPSTLDTAPPGWMYLVGTDDPTFESIGEMSLIYAPSE